MTDLSDLSPPTSGSTTVAPVQDGLPAATQAATQAALHDFVRAHPRLFVLTGAGISTASGIPGYRDENGDWKRSPPITLQAFLGSEASRRRYWARSMVGWPVVADAQPNDAHHALARLEAAGHVDALVTQNVDGLHQRAGSTDVIELHGSIGAVVCRDCGARHTRAAIQQILAHDNPALLDVSAETAADGDAHLEWEALDSFRIPACPVCGGLLKPDVVFFGEGVPRERVDSAAAALEAADAMLVVGSSLMVYSGYRFCVWAEKLGKPIAAINLGRTRADPLLALKAQLPCGPALTALAAQLAVD